MKQHVITARIIPFNFLLNLSYDKRNHPFFLYVYVQFESQRYYPISYENATGKSQKKML